VPMITARPESFEVRCSYMCAWPVSQSENLCARINWLIRAGAPPSSGGWCRMMIVYFAFKSASESSVDSHASCCGHQALSAITMKRASPIEVCTSNEYQGRFETPVAFSDAMYTPRFTVGGCALNGSHSISPFTY